MADFLGSLPLSSLKGIPGVEEVQWKENMDHAWMVAFLYSSAGFVTGLLSPGGAAFATMSMAYHVLMPLGAAAIICQSYSEDPLQQSPDHGGDALKARVINTTVPPMCRTALCTYRAHTDPSFLGYCCHLCGSGEGHGWHCQHSQAKLHPTPVRSGAGRGHPVVWLHGHAGTVKDREWLLPSLDLSACNLLEISGTLAPRFGGETYSWFQYCGQWAAAGAGRQADAALDCVVPWTLKHVGQERSVTLIGYSQGAAIAVLAAAALRSHGVKVFVFALRGQFEPSLACESSWELNWDIMVYCLQSKRDRSAPYWSSKGSWRELRNKGGTINLTAARGQSHTSISRREVSFIQSHLTAMGSSCEICRT